MRETLAVSLPPRTKRLIARAASQSGLTISDYVAHGHHTKLATLASRHCRGDYQLAGAHETRIAGDWTVASDRHSPDDMTFQSLKLP
jgi:hypothetical protein